MLPTAFGVAVIGLLAGPATIGAPVSPPSPAGDVAGAVSGAERAGAGPAPVAPRSLSRDQLLARVAEVPGPTAPGLLTGYQWPLPHGRITQPFGPSAAGSRLVDGVAVHDGIDLATFCGDRIVAAHGGVVLAAGRHHDIEMGWRGDLAPYFSLLDRRGAWSTLPIIVVVNDGNGYRSIYAHFSRIVVRVGQRIRAGQLLGYEGRTGEATGCHLHYGLFSPAEPAAWQVLPSLVTKYHLPALQTARVDPLLVLPHRAGRPAHGAPAAGRLPD